MVPSKPALILEGKTKSLIVTDIHIGFESSMATNEIFIGKNSTTGESIRELAEIIDSEKPDSIVLLGDVKSTIKSISKYEWEDVPLFFKKISEKCDVTLVPGNHDANIQRLTPGNITMISSVGMIEENVLLTHGHTMPPKNFGYVDKIIMGHLHPVFFQKDSIINGQRVWVLLKTEKKNIFPDQTGTIEITIVPSFNKYLYTTHKRHYTKSISPIINKIKDISDAKIITLDGAIIGNESNIRQVI